MEHDMKPFKIMASAEEVEEYQLDWVRAKAFNNITQSCNQDWKQSGGGMEHDMKTINKIFLEEVIVENPYGKVTPSNINKEFMRSDGHGNVLYTPPEEWKYHVITRTYDEHPFQMESIYDLFEGDPMGIAIEDFIKKYPDDIRTSHQPFGNDEIKKSGKWQRRYHFKDPDIAILFKLQVAEWN